MAPKPQLTYWKGRGRAEFIRLMLAAADIDFEEKQYLDKPEDIEKLKNEGLLQFNQVPLLQWNGLNMVQTGAIVRYIARKYGLFGTNEEDAFRIDMLSEGGRDFNNFFMGFGFGDDKVIIGKLKSETFPRYLPIFEKILSNGDGKFLVGGQLSLADISLLEPLLNMEEKFQDELGAFPKLKDYLAHIKNVPGIHKYLNGPNRHCPNDAAYIASVKRTLGW